LARGNFTENIGLDHAQKSKGAKANKQLFLIYLFKLKNLNNFFKILTPVYL